MLTSYINELAHDNKTYFNMSDLESFAIAIKKVTNTINSKGYIILKDNKQYNMNDLNFSKKELNLL